MSTIMKTNKSLAKRIKITASGKILKRRPRQDHFNAKQSGDAKRAKRGVKPVPSHLVKAAKLLIPQI